MSSNIFDQDDLVENPTARVAVCLCLDVSSSMDGPPIMELTKGIRQFYEAISQDEIAAYAADVCVVTFGGENEARCLVDFTGVYRQMQPPRLIAHGNTTPMGEGVNLALDLLEKRKKKYHATGVDYYQPWLVLMTDGIPMGNANALRDAILRTRQLVEAKKLTLIPIAIGMDADMETLKRFAPSVTPVRLKGTKFNEFFQWLSKSISAVSQSMPGEVVPLPPLDDWND